MKMTIHGLMAECIERGMSVEDTTFEFLRRFPRSVIKNMGGQQAIKKLYEDNQRSKAGSNADGQNSPCVHGPR